MTGLFDEIDVGGIRLRNRVVIPPMCQHSAPGGLASDWHIIHLGGLALSGAGLMILEATAVSPEGRITHDCLGLWSDEHEQALGDVLRRVRQFSDIRVGVQLSHAGRKASARSPRTGGRGPLAADEGAWQTVAASAVPLGEQWPAPAELDEEGMRKAIADFVAAAQSADRIDVDVIELHAAHGYLLSSFLSPIANVRTDQYGGSLENRMRFPLDVFEAVRAVWPPHKALGVRVNGTDWVYGGITPEEAAAFAAALEARGCDFIDVSSGGNAPASIPLYTGYQVPLAATVRQAVAIPVMAVGLIRTTADAQKVLDASHADLIGVGRGHLHNPHWTWDAAEDLSTAVPVPYQYVRAATRAGKPVEGYVK